VQWNNKIELCILYAKHWRLYNKISNETKLKAKKKRRKDCIPEKILS